METILKSLLGGTLIGCAAIILLFANGRIAGVSGILGGTLQKPDAQNMWRFTFLLGLILGGTAAYLLGVADFTPLYNRSQGALMAAGLLVGIGTQLGSGCTSGHGVCGIGRFSLRSVVATITFIVTGMITVYVIHHVMRGSI